MYETPRASPSWPTITSRTIAPVRTSRFPVFMAGTICTPGELKFAFTRAGASALGAIVASGPAV